MAEKFFKSFLFLKTHFLHCTVCVILSVLGIRSDDISDIYSRYSLIHRALKMLYFMVSIVMNYKVMRDERTTMIDYRLCRFPFSLLTYHHVLAIRIIYSHSFIILF